MPVYSINSSMILEVYPQETHPEFPCIEDSPEGKIIHYDAEFSGLIPCINETVLFDTEIVIEADFKTALTIKTALLALDNKFSEINTLYNKTIKQRDKFRDKANKIWTLYLES